MHNSSVKKAPNSRDAPVVSTHYSQLSKRPVLICIFRHFVISSLSQRQIMSVAASMTKPKKAHLNTKQCFCSNEVIPKELLAENWTSGGQKKKCQA